jgi:large subunit ribosomal protein L31
MKKDLHPKINPIVFVDTSCGAQFIATSTLKSDETMDVNGTPHMVINVEISSASHPFYTGKQILVDTARRVEKFQERSGKQGATASARKGKKIKREAKAEKKASETK